MRVAVLGGGHGCYAAAAELTERGHDVWFWRRDTEAFQPLLEAKRITLDASCNRSLPVRRAFRGSGTPSRRCLLRS